jgi:hypothetical protein
LWGIGWIDDKTVVDGIRWNRADIHHSLRGVPHRLSFPLFSYLDVVRIVIRPPGRTGMTVAVRAIRFHRPRRLEPKMGLEPATSIVGTWRSVFEFTRLR